MKRLGTFIAMADGSAVGLVSMLVLMLLLMGCNCALACLPEACPAGACEVETACGNCPVKPVQEANVTTPVLERLINSGVKVTVLDARTGKFDDGSRIPGARSLAPVATAEEVSAAIPAKEALVVTYCASLKCPASKKLAEHLRELGYKNVLEYPAGIAGWREAGNPVENAKEK